MNPGKTLQGRRLYEFGAFRLDPSERIFARNGQRIPLAPKAFDTLLILVQHGGRVLTKEELIKTLWPDSFVEENNLTQHISALRRALGNPHFSKASRSGAPDSGKNEEEQEYIETVPKLGYRFVCEVREIGGDGADLLEPGATEVVVKKRTRTHIVLREEIEESEQDSTETVAAPEAIELAEGVQPQALPAAGPTTTSILHKWKWVLASAGVLVAAVGAVLLARTMRPAQKAQSAPIPGITSVKPRYSVAVLGFKNLSGRTDHDWLSAALAEMLTTELSAGGQLRLVSGEEIHRIKSDLELRVDQSLAKATLDQVRQRAGADVILSGTYLEVGRGSNGQIRLDLQLQDVARGETVFSTAVTGRIRELFALVSRSGAQLRSKLGVPTLSELEGAQDQAAMPSTPEVARYYSEGLYKIRAFDAPAGQKLLSKAVTVDPNFALGHSALASAWSELGYDEKAKSEARRALDLSLSLSSQQHLVIAGQYNEFTRDWDQAVATYQQLIDLFPDSVDYGLLLANAQTFAGKGAVALATLEKLRRLPPPPSQDPRIDLAQAGAAESLGDFKQLLEASERAIHNGESLSERLLVARAWTKKSWALRRLGRTDDAIAGLLEAKRIFAETGDMQGVGSALRLIGGAQQEHGDYSQAERSFQEAIAIFRRTGDRRALAMSINGLAIAHYERGDLAGAKALDEQYLAIEREVGSKVNTAGALGNIANVEDARGNLAEAQRLNEESLKIFAEVGDQRAIGTALGNLAVVLYEQGDLEGARKKIEDALELKRKIGYQRGIGYDLSALGEVFRVEGNLVAARQKQEEALKIREQIGEEHNAAASRLCLAMLELEELRPTEAQNIAKEAAQKFHQEGSATDEAAAEEIVARSLLAQGKITDAEAAINRASALARGATNLPLSFDISATSARIRIAAKNPPNASSIASAKKEIESSLAVARRCGYLEYEYKLNLALDEIELQSGEVRQGRARLEALAKTASEKGFGLIAHNATVALKSQPIP